MLPPEGATVDAAWQSLAARWKALGPDPQQALMKKVPYSGVLGVVRSGDRIMGITGSASENELRENLAKRLRVAVPAS